jgi:hypothetical protein
MANGTTRFIIGIAASVVLAVAGWGTTAVLATKMGVLNNAVDDVKFLQTYAVSNDKRITTLEAQYGYIIKGIDEVKGLLQSHVQGGGG